MVIVTPETVIAWHRQGFRLFWRWKSRHRGRPTASAEVRTLIRTMSEANPLWGAPRIHGELLKLGIEISQATVGTSSPFDPSATAAWTSTAATPRLTAAACVASRSRGMYRSVTRSTLR